jgi:hypothetical protein
MAPVGSWEYKKNWERGKPDSQKDSHKIDYLGMRKKIVLSAGLILKPIDP